MTLASVADTDLWGPAVGGTIYPDLQPTVDPRLTPPKVPYTRGAPVTFPTNSQYIPDGVQLAPGEVCLPGEVYDVPGTPIEMIDSGLEPTSVVPAAPNYAPQNELTPQAQQGNAMPRGSLSPPQPASIPSPVILPEMINGSFGKAAPQPGFTMPGQAPVVMSHR